MSRVLGCCMQLLALAACGGRAQVGDTGSGGSVLGSAPGFLFECQQSCGYGLSCIDGTCTRACAEDDECFSLSNRAGCVQNREGHTPGQCAVACGSDDGCAELGAGSYCGGAFCVAARLEAMPDRFETLELSRRLDQPAESARGECDPAVLATNIELNVGRRLLSVVACELSSGGGYVQERRQTVLDDAEVRLIEGAYRELRLDGESRCEGDGDIFSLELQPASGLRMLFADDAHSSCPPVGTPRLTSALDNLEGLYDVLVGLSAGQ
ncbi:MAG TPA: hypothetical protein VNN80_00905 [Polyangiaceae bacterium]|nr:hypothetical protein [Polyangiaceae bacterium]